MVVSVKKYHKSRKKINDKVKKKSKLNVRQKLITKVYKVSKGEN